jgi:hypothetical protein
MCCAPLHELAAFKMKAVNLLVTLVTLLGQLQDERMSCNRACTAA